MWWWWEMEWWWCRFSFLSFRLINLGFVDLFVLFDFYRFGLWFVFWVLISLCSLGWYMMGLGFDFSVPWVDSSCVWVSFGFSILWLISRRSGLVFIFLFFESGFEFLFLLYFRPELPDGSDPSHRVQPKIRSVSGLFCSPDSIGSSAD